MKVYPSLPVVPPPQETMSLEDSCYWLAQWFSFAPNEGAVAQDWSGRLLVNWHPPLGKGGDDRYKAELLSHTGCPRAIGWGFSPRTALQSLAIELDKRGLGRASKAKEICQRDWPQWLLGENQ